MESNQSTIKWVHEYADQHESEMILMDGYEDCIVGVVERFGQGPFVLYDRSKVIKKLMSDGMSYEEALEFHDFNQAGLFAGPGTFGFLIGVEDE